jgi:hypothetical protein
MSDTPETDNVARGNHVVPTEFAQDLERQLGKMRSALQRLGDCDWTISLPDRMDAVRKIAREALQ